MSRHFVVRDATQVGHEGHVWGGGTRIAFDEDRGLGVFTVEGDTHDVPLDQAKAELDAWVGAGYVVETDAPAKPKPRAKAKAKPKVKVKSRSTSGGPKK